MRNNNSGSGLVKLLTALLLTCTVVEVGIASYVGVTMQTNRRAAAEAAARYETYQEQRRQDREEPAVIQYIGPEVQVSNGELVRGTWEPAQPEEHGNSVVSDYTPPAVPKSDIPEVNTDLEIKKAEVQPVQPSTKPETSASTPKSSSGNTSAADVPKPSNSGSGSSVGTSGSSGGNAPTAKNSDGTYKHDFSGGRVLGTKNSNKYHNSDCIGARKIPPENEVWYTSVSDAVADGREACGSCYR